MTGVTTQPMDERAVPTPARWSRVDVVAVLILAIGAAIICTAAIVRRADLNAASAFLYSDAGVNLWLAERIAEGARLYRDLGFSYGPLAIYPYAWFARVFGNTPQGFDGFLAAWSVVGIVLSYRLLRRSVSRGTAVLVVAGGLYATLLLPGSLIFGPQSSAYFVLERVIFLAVLLSWRPSATRGVGNAVATGVLLGVWQGVRFGSALFVGAAIVAVDLLALYFIRADRATILRWIRLGLITTGCFLAVEGLWAVWAYSSLPAADARDFLWPSYVLESFDEWPDTLRWPRFVSVPLFVGQQLFPIGAAALGAIAFWWALRHRNGRVSPGATTPSRVIAADDLVMLIPWCFFMFGAAGLFRAVGHFHQYAWTLPFAAGLAIDRGGRRLVVAFVLLALPGTAVLLRANLITRPGPDRVMVRAPNSGYVVVSEAERRRTEVLREYATSPVSRSLIFVPVGTGFHAFFDTRFRGRQSFFILGFPRGDDANVMLHTLASEPAALVLLDHPSSETPGPDPCTWFAWRHFSADLCARLATRIDAAQAIRVDEKTWIIPGVMDADRSPPAGPVPDSGRAGPPAPVRDGPDRTR